MKQQRICTKGCPGHKAVEKKISLLSPETIVEVVRTKDGEPTVKNLMKLHEWSNLKKQAGYHYVAYQKGFSAF